MNLLFNDEDNDEDNDDHDDDNGGGGGDGVFFSSAFSCVSSTIMPQRFKTKLPKSHADVAEDNAWSSDTRNSF